ncbi:ribonuclease H-like domain-containing protein [Tanacetum coccineum]
MNVCIRIHHFFRSGQDWSACEYPVGNLLDDFVLAIGIKDFLTRHILLRCDSSGDLYPVSKPSTILTTFVSTSSSTWHQRLSHSGDKVLRGMFISLTLRFSVLSLYGLKASTSEICRFSVTSLCVSLVETLIWTEASTSCLVSEGSEVAYLLIYVDLIILTASSTTLLQQIITFLHNEFNMIDLGALNYFLGYSPFYKIVSVSVKLHLAAHKRILQYVWGTLDFGLHLYSSTTTSIVGYIDADWTGCPSTRRPILGYYVFLGDNLLSWSSKRQHTLSRFNVDAEYCGVANVVAKTAWLRNLIHELHSPLSYATLV